MVLTFSVPVEKPMAPPSRMMPTPTMESSPRLRASITVMGAKAMKVFTPWVVQMSANTSIKSGMKTLTLPLNRRTMEATRAWRAPVAVSMWMAAPLRRIRVIRSALAEKALIISMGS